MIALEEFSAWMRENSTLSDSSVYKYTRAVNTISNEMKEKGVITESLLAMSVFQLDIFVPLILQPEPYPVSHGNSALVLQHLKHHRKET